MWNESNLEYNFIQVCPNCTSIFTKEEFDCFRLFTEYGLFFRFCLDCGFNWFE